MTDAVAAHEHFGTSVPREGCASAESKPGEGGRKASFRSLIMRAAGWSIVGYMALQILRISSSLILTRLLMPEMFGVMAVATTIQVSVAMLSDLGLRPAAIQSRMGDDPTYLDTAWTVQFIHGCLIWLVCVLAALTIDAAAEGGILPASSVYAVPELPGILMATSFSCVIAGLQSMKVVSAYRHLDLKRLTAIEIAAQVISLLVAIALAWSTGSIWSFVISTLVAALVTTGLSHAWLQGRTNVFRWHKDAVVDLIRFGRWIILSSMLTVVAASGDRFFLAGWVGPFTLGLYVLAFNLVAMLEGAGGRLFSSVAMPALSKVARDQPERLRAMFLKVRLPFDLVFVAGAGAVFSAGQMLTDLLYDDRYRDAGPMIQVLSFGLLTARYGTLSAIYLVVNEPRNQTVLNLVRAVSIFTSMPLAYHLLGFNGALWAIAIYGLPGVFVSLYFNGRHGLNNLLYEFSVLAAWPAGYAAGHLASLIYYAFKIDL